MLTPDQQRVKELLCETITLLCKNGLHFQSEFCIDGLIGITLDRRDVFLVSIKETVKHGEVFVRDRQHCTRNVDEVAHVGSRIRISSSSENQQNFNKTCKVYGKGPRHPESSSITLSNLPPLPDPAANDDAVDFKTEETEYSAVSGDNLPIDAERRSSSCVAANSVCSVQSDCNNEMMATPPEDFAAENPCPGEDSSASYNDGSFNPDEANLSQSGGAAQIARDSFTAQSKYISSESQRLNVYEGPEDDGSAENRTESQMNLEDSDFKWHSGDGNDGEASDDEALVVVKVEPPSTDYSEEPFSISSADSKGRSGCGSKVLDHGNLYGEIGDMSGGYFQHPGSSSSNHKIDASGQTIGYSQFSQSLSTNRNFVKVGNSPVSLPNEILAQNIHLLNSEKSKSLVPLMSKPYKRLDYGKISMEKDLPQSFPLPDMNAGPDNETILTTDLEKYAEAQNFCMNRRVRSTFSAYQLQRLENAFKCAHYIDAATRNKLAEELNLSDSIILVWFQNRRQKYKKQMKMSLP